MISFLKSQLLTEQFLFRLTGSSTNLVIIVVGAMTTLSNDFNSISTSFVMMESDLIVNVFPPLGNVGDILPDVMFSTSLNSSWTAILRLLEE